MFKNLFLFDDPMVLPVIGMLLFLTLFASAILWVARRRPGAHFRRMAQLPLEDEG